MIQLHDLTLSFGMQEIFKRISCQIRTDQKIGLVGRNGAGKSTLLNVIAGTQKPDYGTVSIDSSTTIAYMPQDVVLTSSHSILIEALRGNYAIQTIVDQLVVLESKAEKNCLTLKESEHYAQLHHDAHELHYENIKAKAQQILAGLGFSQDQFSASVATLSVGWKMRLVLAKLLLQEADFYLFDEPTNHLDLSAKDWFIDFLQKASCGFMLVSHDKYFLDTVCDHICEIARGNFTCYTGNFEHYLTQKEAAAEQLEKKFEHQQKMVQQKTSTIKRFAAKATKARMAQSMLKALSKIELIEPEFQEKAVAITLPKTLPTGKIVLKVTDLGFSFANKKIFDHANLEIFRHHKVALVAPNGTGKSTFLNVIMGNYKHGRGTFSFGHNVKAAFFEQDQNKSLNHNNTILEEVESACTSSEDRARVRGLLGAFLFSGNDVEKRICVLSGGEKNRVAMVKILLAHANFLILDEPTNHLDLISKEILLNALNHYDGTLLFVSHDRDFLNNLATDIVELTPHGMHHYAGNYDEYLYHKQQTADTAVRLSEQHAQKNTEKLPDRKLTQEHRRKITQLESRINKLEHAHDKLVNDFASITYQSPLYATKTAELKKNEQAIQEAYAEWEALINQ